jgi:hypothetical protein
MSTFAKLFTVAMLALSASHAVGQSCNTPIDSLRQVLDSKACDPIEGLWQFVGDGATVAITARAGYDGQFDITLLDSPDMSIAPMTICGQLQTTAKVGAYDARLRLKPADGIKSRTKDCVITLTDTGRFSIAAYNRTKRISLWRWLPYLFRVTVIQRSNRPENLDGALRTYPTGAPTKPIIL